MHAGHDDGSRVVPRQEFRNSHLVERQDINFATPPYLRILSFWSTTEMGLGRMSLLC